MQGLNLERNTASRRTALAPPRQGGLSLAKHALKPTRVAPVRAGEGSSSGGRQPWDFGRFVQTVLFFNPPPKPEKVLESVLTAPFQLLKGLSSGETEQKKTAVLQVLAPNTLATPQAAAGAAVPSEGVILVAGATGGVGKRVVQQLLAQGRKVRALVRDVSKAQELLSSLPVAAGGALELVAGDITQKQTLLPEMFQGVVALINASAVKVQPKEGDTKDRQKYYQGIKFYDPEIVGDTPETVEYVGMQNLINSLKENLGVKDGVVLLDGSSSSVNFWGPLDDVVMGGVSKSGLEYRSGAGEDGAPAAVFTGFVSTDNSGGFASVRSKNFEPTLNLKAYTGVKLRLFGNGLRFKLTIRPDTNWDGIGYTKSFDTKAGEWQTVTLPFSEFVPVFRARTVTDGPKFDASSVASIQLMLSKFEYDGQLNPNFQAGSFELPLASIKAYIQEPVAPRVVHVGSAGVTRPNRPGINVDMEPPAVKLNDALGGILTYKLKGEDVIRDSGIPYAIVRPVALTEEPRGAPLEFGQGDVIKGKISREDVAELCIHLLQETSADGVTFEVKSTIPFSQPWEVDATSLPSARDWSDELGRAALKPYVTGKTVDGMYIGTDVDPTAAPKSVPKPVVTVS